MIVREESLAGFSRDCQFDHYIKLGKGEEKSGGRTVIRFLATYLKLFLGSFIGSRSGSSQTLHLSGHDSQRLKRVNFSQVIDYKTRLQELLQVHGDVEIQYQVVSESGPAHAKEFEVEVFVNGQTMGHGHGRSKKVSGAGSSPQCS